MCRSGYITADNSVVSKSGLYFTDLAGCTISLLTDLVKEDQADSDECFEYLYKMAWLNLKTDVHIKLANLFHIDKKLITRETSTFLPDFNSGSALAGVKIQVSLPKYARVQIISITVNSENAHASPDAAFYVYNNDENGELLSTIESELDEGKNVIDVYQNFEDITLNGVCKLFVCYDPDVLSLKTTQNKYYATNNYLNKMACTFPCYWGSDGYVAQVNNGGIDVKFIVYCDLDKFICDNLPIFASALFYRLGIDTMKERITTQNTNISSVLSEDRAKELMAIFDVDYRANLDAATMNLRMSEDPICFMCKRSVSSKPILP